MGYKQSTRFEAQGGFSRDIGTSQEIERGQEHELDAFGVPFKGRELRQYRTYVKEHSSETGYMSRTLGMDAIKRFYPEGKEVNPEKNFANDLRLEIIENLDIHPDWTDDVRIYSALGTNVDIFHGTDAWIEMPTERGKPLVLTMDASLKTIKVEGGYKADIVVGKLPDVESDEYLEEVEKHASSLVDKYRQKMSYSGQDPKFLQEPRDFEEVTEELSKEDEITEEIKKEAAA